MPILDEVKQRFPDCSVALTLYAPFINKITVYYEEGKKYFDDGSTNPSYFWHEWGFLVDTDESKVNWQELSNGLDRLEVEKERQISYYHSPEYKEA